MGLEVLPKTLALILPNLSPIGLTEPPFVKVFGWDLGPSEKEGRRAAEAAGSVVAYVVQYGFMECHYDRDGHRDLLHI